MAANHPIKWCGRCKTNKPIEAFAKNRAKKDGLNQRCRQCCKEFGDANRDKRRRRDRERYAKNRDRIRARDNERRKTDAYRRWKKEHYAKNKQRILEYNCQWRENNREAYNSYARERRRKNPGISIAAREWYYRTRSHRQEQRRIYAEKNRDFIREKDRKYYREKYRDKKCILVRRYAQENRQRISRRVKSYYQKHKQLFRAHAAKYEARKRGLLCDFGVSDMRFAVTFWREACAVCETKFAETKDTRLHFDHWIPLTRKGCIGTIPANMLPVCRRCNAEKWALEPKLWLKRKLGKKLAITKLTAIRAFFRKCRKVES